MYEDIDDDFAGNYDPKKQAEKQLTPFFPFCEHVGQLTLKRVKKDKSPKKGKYFQFEFQVDKTNSELVQAGARYVMRYNQGASDVDNEICWRNMLPILMAANGFQPSDKAALLQFAAPKALGEFLSLSKDGDLDLPVGHVRKMEPCQPDKNGVVKHKNEDGTPKDFPRDTWSPVTSA